MPTMPMRYFKNLEVSTDNGKQHKYHRNQNKNQLIAIGYSSLQRISEKKAFSFQGTNFSKYKHEYKLLPGLVDYLLKLVDVIT